MRLLFRLFSLFDLKKAKFAVLTGLLGGLLLATIFVDNQNENSEMEFRDLAARFTSLIPRALAEGRDEAAIPRPPEAVAEEEAAEEEPGPINPRDFLDASISRITEALDKKKPNAPVVLDSGEQIHFSIIPSLQDAVERQYKSYQPLEAGFVAMDPRTGEILAIAGWEDGQLAPHRALEADGPAASVFKVVTAAALVETQNVRPRKQVCYHGGRSGIAARLLKPNPEKDRNCVSVSEAMGKSTNVVFARLAYNKLDRNVLRKYGEKFGFNRVIPFEWPIGLSKMDVPKDRVEFARMAAGFYHAEMSPMHGALLAGAVANKGMMMMPKAVTKVTDPEGTVLYDLTPETFQQVVTPETADKLTDMMHTTTTIGTASKYFRKRSPALKNVQIAGKTGSLSRKWGKSRKYYSWFVGFAPADNPQIAFASLVVNPPKWKVKGTPIAKKALHSYFTTLAKNKKKGKEPIKTAKK